MASAAVCCTSMVEVPVADVTLKNTLDDPATTSSTVHLKKKLMSFVSDGFWPAFAKGKLQSVSDLDVVAWLAITKALLSFLAVSRRARERDRDRDI